MTLCQSWWQGTGWWHGSTWFQASTWWLCWRPPTSGHQWAPPLLPPPLSTLSTFLPLSGTLAKLAEHPPGGEFGIYKPSALLSDSPHPALAATARPPPWGWTANKNIPSVSASCHKSYRYHQLWAKIERRKRYSSTVDLVEGEEEEQRLRCLVCDHIFVVFHRVLSLLLWKVIKRLFWSTEI